MNRLMSGKQEFSMNFASGYGDLRDLSAFSEITMQLVALVVI